MYFTKFPHRSNFSFVESYSEPDSTIKAGNRQFSASLTTYLGEIAHVQVSDTKLWGG